MNRHRNKRIKRSKRRAATTRKQSWARKVVKFGLATALVTQAVVCAKNGGALRSWVPTWVRDAVVVDRPTTTAAGTSTSTGTPPKFKLPYRPWPEPIPRAVATIDINGVVKRVAYNLSDDSTSPWNKTSPDEMVELSNRLARQSTSASAPASAPAGHGRTFHTMIGIGIGSAIAMAVMKLVERGIRGLRGLGVEDFEEFQRRVAHFTTV